MSSEPEVHFCNICNQSIPESALTTGCAVRVEGRIVPVATAGTAEAGAAPGRNALVAAVLIIVSAIVAVGVFLDSRVTRLDDDLRRGLAGAASPMVRFGDQLEAVDRRVAAGVVASDLASLEVAIADNRELVRTDVRELGDAIRDGAVQTEAVLAAGRRRDEALVQHGARLALLQDELRALSRQIAELAARPIAEVEPPPRGDAGVPRPDPESGSGLPAEIAHHVSRLTDADDGTRFEAVDQLLQIEDPRIVALILPLAKDTDMFVRRLVLEGLSEHRAAESVDALITALADPEEVVRHTAHLGLKRLTGEDIAFDPGASAEQRGGMQRRWKAWWDKNRDSF